MDRFWQWGWDRYGAGYSWVCFAFTFAALLPIYLLGSLVVVAYEKSDRYAEAAAFTVAAVVLLAYVIVLPGVGGLCTAQRWAAGREVERAHPPDGRRYGVRTVWAHRPRIACP
jgi:adenylate cyclase